VLKVRPFFDDGGDFILVKISGRILQHAAATYLGEKLFPLVLLELRNGLLEEESSLICGGGHGW
jgi:hypothetical protein